MNLVWFRSDLRITDNPALFCASETSEPLLAVFYICEKQWQQHDYGVNKVDFIIRQLTDLQKSLTELNIPLLVFAVDFFSDIPNHLAELSKKYAISKVWCNKEYEVNEVARDLDCAQSLAQIEVAFESLHDQCILPPNTVTTKDDAMYKVFTPFFKRWQAILDISPVECVPAPQAQKAITQLPLDESHVQIPNLQQYDTAELAENITSDFPASEVYATACLQNFIEVHISDYQSNRDLPSIAGTSQLSPYLAVGAISARQCYTLAKQFMEHDHTSGMSGNAKKSIHHWISELCWRDFYRHIIVSYPNIVRGQAFNVETDNCVPWRYDQGDFQAWCEGNTGVPLVDAAMRCLNATGFMHNRLRMVVAMFLTKNLLIDWRWGERYFMKTLIDADFASNNGGWQWSASVGTDAAPYFRIMNPFSQAKTHDVEAVFIKQWCPELAKVAANTIHDVDKLVKVCRSVGYPQPIVDVKLSRKQAIETFKYTKSSSKHTKKL